ncbi:hypothetical protein CFBP5507_24465 (plasmid) [Agrobacterium salinitolerans]|uniref:Uncharacterized protein n=1 Tax=Agrobacterium salinitolerans TaxID=1183413 RepID=A0A9X9PD19_9HYPH|nr:MULTISPECIES: hypothetical protein [Agrobacterium]MDH6297805.1 hypothetical protein [Agrobacterium fabrum]UYZ10990.1 hypothetical protein CFBP5507_24465 [Agrobacterium salinitolerans]
MSIEWRGRTASNAQGEIVAKSTPFYFLHLLGCWNPTGETMEADGLCGYFFDSFDEARSAVIALREGVAADPEMEWATTVV